MKKRSSLSRRDALKAIALGSLAGCATGQGRRSADVIRKENARAGSRDWMLTKTRIDPAAKYRCPWIEGYCSKTSARAGETIDFFVSTNPASSFRLEIFRTGFYGGERSEEHTSELQ